MVDQGTGDEDLEKARALGTEQATAKTSQQKSVSARTTRAMGRHPGGIRTDDFQVQGTLTGARLAEVTTGANFTKRRKSPFCFFYSQGAVSPPSRCTSQGPPRLSELFFHKTEELRITGHPTGRGCSSRM